MNIASCGQYLSFKGGIKEKAALKCVSCESQYLNYAPVWQEEIISAAYEINNVNLFNRLVFSENKNSVLLGS